MPYKVRLNKNGKYDIVRKDTGDVVGTSDSERKAKASIMHRISGK